MTWKFFIGRDLKLNIAIDCLDIFGGFLEFAKGIKAISLIIQCRDY